MHILIVSQYFWPENFKINDLTSELLKKGHQVTIVTGKPNYPKGKFFRGYGIFSKIKSNYFGATIFRLPVIPRRNSSKLMLSLNYLSFVFTGSLFLLFHRKKYDFSFVFAVSPITQAIPAIVHRKLYGTKLFLWVLDLWPESATANDRLNSHKLSKILLYLVKYIYKNSDRILISTKLMEKSISEKIDNHQIKQIVYLPNWAEDIFTLNKIDKNKYSSLMPDGFIVMFAGNIGYGQDCQSIIKTVQLLKDQINIKFIFLGGGSEVNYLQQKILEFGLENRIFLLGEYPLEEMPNFYVHADVLLITLRNEEIYSYTVPGKLQSYMSFGKPVIGMINGESADIINSSKCGLVCKAGDYEKLAANLIHLANLPKISLEQFGNNGREYYKENFDKESIINKIIRT